MNTQRLAGKVAVVAGGATGIGAAICREFVRNGVAGLIIADTNVGGGTELAAALAAEPAAASTAQATAVHFAKLDVTNETDWQRGIAEAEARFGGLDLLVNSAGIGGPLVRPQVTETTVEAWDKVLDINAKGVLLGMKHAIPAMKRRSGGAIVNIASVYALVGPEFATSYAASKGACRALSRAAAIQYAADKIRVNAVFPGFIDTPMTRDIHSQGPVRETRLALTPLGRFGRPEEIAYGVVYLCSDEAAYVTGAELVIDGGITAR